MFSPKTKDVPPKRTFLIILSLFVVNGGLFGLFANQVTAISKTESTFVKDESVSASGVDHIAPDESVSVNQIVAQDDKPLITIYTVKPGDTLSTIASKFSISTNTILWANDLTKKSVVKVGQKLTILPVSGVVYTVAKGNTLGSIALKFDADIDEIIAFNDLEDDQTIRAGMNLIIPNGELPLEKKPVVETKKVTTKKEAPAKAVAKSEIVSSAVQEKENEKEEKIITKPTSGYYTHPIPGSVLTQGAHGYNSVDFGAPIGTPVVASAGGKVIVAKPTGYNGGYGKNIVIEHENGTQTLYAHLSSVSVSVDDVVTKGETIALSGNTGRSTGPHLHFEVRGGTNPWVGTKKMTKF